MRTGSWRQPAVHVLGDGAAETGNSCVGVGGIAALPYDTATGLIKTDVGT